MATRKSNLRTRAAMSCPHAPRREAVFTCDLIRAASRCASSRPATCNPDVASAPNCIRAEARLSSALVPVPYFLVPVPQGDDTSKRQGCYEQFNCRFVADVVCGGDSYV